ncbi:MAG: hypothetical protein IKV90_01925 [Clostridia bacterium]|nr:hypothetical protein [Clostridia bacterium]
MKKKRKWAKALFNCFCISLLFVVFYQMEDPRIESVEEALFIVVGCTLSFYIWYGIGVLFFNSFGNQTAGSEGSQYNSGGVEPRRIVAAEIVDVQYKTKVKTNYPKAIAMSMLGKRMYGHAGGILGAASGSRLETTPKKVLFAVLYSNGTQKMEKVNYGSMRYKTLMRYVE